MSSESTSSLSLSLSRDKQRRPTWAEAVANDSNSCACSNYSNNNVVKREMCLPDDIMDNNAQRQRSSFKAWFFENEDKSCLQPSSKDTSLLPSSSMASSVRLNSSPSPSSSTRLLDECFFRPTLVDGRTSGLRAMNTWMPQSM